MVKSVVRITKDGQNLEKALRDLNKLQVRIGYQQGKETYEYEDGVSVDMCDVAMWNELGNARIPSRPFIRDAIDNHVDEINDFFEMQKHRLVSTGDVQTMLNQCGLKITDLIQTEIRDGNFVENSPYTIAKKHSSHPLIDTGRLRQSVHHIIVEKGGDYN